jgi:hypothetical protein
MEPTGDETTRLLAELGRGDRSAADRLLPLVYQELRDLASAFFRRERSDHTLHGRRREGDAQRPGRSRAGQEGISTVEADWRMARAWLLSELADG